MNNMDLSGVRIGVLGGGVSPEREISLISARQVFEVFKRNKLNVEFIDVCSANKEEVKKDILLRTIDLAFIALHGEFGEDGTIQAILEELYIPYTGSGPAASYKAMDKIVSKEIFLKEGVPTASFCVVASLEEVPKDIKYPVVVKPYFAGSSLGVSIVKESSGLIDAVNKGLSLQSKVILEEYVQGREFTVGILEESYLEVVEIITKGDFFDFHTKYSDGMVEFKAPADLPSEVYKKIQEVGLQAHQVLGCRDFSRVDIRVNKDNKVYVLEVNSIPGLTLHSLLPLSAKCRGISFDELILKMGRLAVNGKIQAQKI
jgi:D-alanine-D-alanine ligase